VYNSTLESSVDTYHHFRYYYYPLYVLQANRARTGVRRVFSKWAEIGAGIARIIREGKVEKGDVILPSLSAPWSIGSTLCPFAAANWSGIELEEPTMGVEVSQYRWGEQRGESV
jgi:hypothetical protein